MGQGEVSVSREAERLRYIRDEVRLILIDLRGDAKTRNKHDLAYDVSKLEQILVYMNHELEELKKVDID